MSEKTRRWVMFSVCGSCLPFFLNLLGPMAIGDNFPGLGPITEHGDLYLVGAALCGASLGELFGIAETKKEVKQYAGFAGIVCFFSCAFLYAYAATHLVGLKTYLAIWVQGITFVISALSSVACISASEAK